MSRESKSVRTMLVIGLGRFGKHLATKLVDLGNEVMVVDVDEEIVKKIAPLVTNAQIGDCMDPDVLSTLGVRNFDVCFVCMSDNFQSSLEITSLLKEMGAKCVVAKTDREIHAKFLYKIGADNIIFPERDMAQRAAVKYSTKNSYDYIELTPEYAIFELLAPALWVGKTVSELNVRSAHNINIIGTKKDGKVTPMTDAGHIFTDKEHLIIAGAKDDLIKLSLEDA